MIDKSRKIRLLMSLRKSGVTDTAVLGAIERVPREVFVAASFQDQAYEDMALPIGMDQTISQPLVVALMTQALATASPADAGSLRRPGGHSPRRPDGRGARMAEVLDAVSRCTGIDTEALIAPGQQRSVVRARHLIMVMIRQLCPGISLSAIGYLLNRDHSTVRYGCRRAAALLRSDPAFREFYRRTRRAVDSGAAKGGSHG